MSSDGDGGGATADDEYTNLLQSLLPALSIHIFLAFHLLLLACIMLTISLSSSM